MSTLADEQSKELIRLCRAGKLYEVEAWIKSGESLTVPAEFRASPLEVAVETGFHSLVLLLARNERHQQIKNRALQKATELRKSELIELLVDEGAKISEVPLLYALSTWDPKIIQFYLDRGTDTLTDHPFADAFCERIRIALRPFARYRDSETSSWHLLSSRNSKVQPSQAAPVLQEESRQFAQLLRQPRKL